MLDRDCSSLTVCFPPFPAGEFAHVEMLALSRGDDGGYSPPDPDATWTSLHPRFPKSTLKKNNLSPAQAYAFRYRLRDAVDYTSALSAVSEPCSPEPAAEDLGEGARVSPKPQAAKRKPADPGCIALEWDPVPDATGYTVSMLCSGEPRGYSVIGTVKNPSVLKRKLSPAHSYRFRVLAVLPDPSLAHESRASPPLRPPPPVPQFARDNLSPSLLVKTSATSHSPSPLSAVLSGKPLLLLYFSASWCGPCRQFTPALARFYQKHYKEMAVVFVSADRSEGEMEKYYTGEHPWAAIPYDDDQREALQGKYRVNGIPKLLVLAPDGRVIDENGVQSVGGGDGCVERWKKTL
ncbi:hypothetical protein TeGR_g13713 [Tetraparma gracilis]|uniref:protein-disulfide reductase n=1 Tax=Tetraparma gracilis TaxID=2962635 RepID=A0ABQ6MAR7_9STRA|nr:hypothetical protein TeGR_g13713 [Tetraparma gracilis]